MGVTSQCNWPVEVSSRPKVGAFWYPNLEAIIAIRPDLVIGLEIPSHCLVAARLQRLGYRCLLLRMDRLEDLFAAIRGIGEAADCTVQAKGLCDELEGRIMSHGEARPRRPRVLFVVQRRPLRVAGPGTFIHQAIELAGGANAVSVSPYRYPPISTEQVLVASPEVIIEPAGVEDVTCLANDPFWAMYWQVPAVACGRIYQVNQDLVSRLGPRIADGIAQIARCLDGM
jgi:iron complex transport system substrate-binding protein